jgi:hypothetical protein
MSGHRNIIVSLLRPVTINWYLDVILTRPRSNVILQVHLLQDIVAVLSSGILGAPFRSSSHGFQPYEPAARPRSRLLTTA